MKRSRSVPLQIAAVALFLTSHRSGYTAPLEIFDGVFPVLLSKQPSGATRLEWPEPDRFYDIVRGDLGRLREWSGDFSLATERCSADDLIALGLDDADKPVVGQGFWYLVRWDQNDGFPEFGAQSYNGGSTQRAHQVADRDEGIQVSARDCGCYYFCCSDFPGQCFFSPWP